MFFLIGWKSPFLEWGQADPGTGPVEAGAGGGASGLQRADSGPPLLGGSPLSLEPISTHGQGLQS